MGQPKKLISDLTRGSVLRRLVLFTLPLVAANTLQVCYNLVDMAFVGRFAGTVAMSAVSIGGQWPFSLVRLCIGLCTGGQIYIAQQVGARDRDSLNAIIGNLLSLCAIGGAAFTAVSLLFARPILKLFNTPPEAMEETLRYFLITSAALLLTFGYNALCTILRGMGDSSHPMVFMAVSTGINIALDYLFVGPLAMGAAGAAWATVISQAAAFGYALCFLLRRREHFGFDFRPASFVLRRHQAGLLLKLGMPIALQNTAVGTSIIVVNVWINGLGIVAVAVAGVGQKLQNIMSIMGEALATAVATLTGQNMGAGEQGRVKRTVWLAWLLGLGFFAVVAAVFLLLPTQVFSLFTDDAEVLAYAPRFLPACVVTMFGMAAMAPTLGLISGVGFTSLNMAIGILDGVAARLSLSWLLGAAMGMGVLGYYLGNGLAGLVSVACGAVYFFSGLWKKRALVEERRI